MTELPMSGNVAIVTGANHGIGAATALALAARGCAVLCAYWLVHDPVDPGIPEQYRRNRTTGAEPVLAEIRAGGGRAVAVEADLTDPAVPARLFDAAEAQLGPVDILVNNAGRHAERGASWGRIVGLISGGERGFPDEVSYGAAKAAQANYTMSAAVELAGLGITANLVHPPVTDTGWVTEVVRETVAASPELVHVATPAQVAEVIAYLCSDAAALITGNVLTLR